jgi:FkbM family methyltransferase
MHDDSSGARARATIQFRGRTFSIECNDTKDHLYLEITRSGTFYEVDLLRYMDAMADCFTAENSLAIDVGANIGNHSIFFASYLVGHVIAVEPNARVASLLRANLGSNVANFTVKQLALGNSPGRGRVVGPREAAGNVGMTQIRSIGEDEPGSVEITSLDAVVDSYNSTASSAVVVTLIKIDVEGMELDVLRGATEVLKRDRPHIFVEAATREHFQSLRAFLAQYGYLPLSRWAVTPVYHFAHQPSAALRLRSRRLKLASEIVRPLEFRRAVRKAIGLVRSLRPAISGR